MLGKCNKCAFFHKETCICPAPVLPSGQENREGSESVRRCVIVCGGEYAPIGPLREGDFVIACDSGYRWCLREGIRPDLLLGDFDSLKGELPEEIPVPEESEVKVSGWLEEGKPLRLTVAEEGQEKKPGRNRNRSRRKGGQGPRPEGAQAAAPKERREAPRGDWQEKGDKPPRESRGEKNQQPRQKAQGGKPRENRPQEGQKKQPRPEAAAAHGGQDPQSAGKKPGKRPFYHNRKPKKPGGPGPQAQSK